MKEILNQYKEIILNLMITAVILGVVSMLGVLASQQVSTRTTRVEIEDGIKEYRELSIYDGRELTGNDIVIALKKYADKYSIYVETPNGNFAFRKVCVEEPNKDMAEHSHKNQNTVCTPVWLFDDLGVSNSLSGNVATGYKVVSGGVGGSNLSDRSEIYDNEFVTSKLNVYLSDMFKADLMRWKFDETRKGLQDSLDNAPNAKKREEILELIADYERRKDDIYGLRFKLKN